MKYFPLDHLLVILYYYHQHLLFELQLISILSGFVELFRIRFTFLICFAVLQPGQQ